MQAAIRQHVTGRCDAGELLQRFPPFGVLGHANGEPALRTYEAAAGGHPGRQGRRGASLVHIRALADAGADPSIQLEQNTVKEKTFEEEKEKFSCVRA